MKQNQTFNWALAWIFTVIMLFAVMQDAGLKGITGEMVGISGVATTEADCNSLTKKCGGSLAWRNNNPGNLKSGINQIGIYKEYAVFETEEKGMDALVNDLRIKLEGNSDAMKAKYPDYSPDTTTLKQLIEIYSPSSENDINKYLESLKQQTGYTETTKLKDIETPKLANAIKVHEGWKEGTGCFLHSTQITLNDGKTKQIQNIEVGDKVLSYDLENNRPVASKVLNVFSHTENEYLIVNDKIKVTPYQYMYINGEWKQIGKAKAGDYLMDSDGNKIKINSIEKAYDKDGVMVYDLEIKDYHYYFADGVLVHNSGDEGLSYDGIFWKQYVKYISEFGSGSSIEGKDKDGKNIKGEVTGWTSDDSGNIILTIDKKHKVPLDNAKKVESPEGGGGSSQQKSVSGSTTHSGTTLPKDVPQGAYYVTNMDGSTYWYTNDGSMDSKGSQILDKGKPVSDSKAPVGPGKTVTQEGETTKKVGEVPSKKTETKNSNEISAVKIWYKGGVETHILDKNNKLWEKQSDSSYKLIGTDFEQYANGAVNSYKVPGAKEPSFYYNGKQITPNEETGRFSAADVGLNDNDYPEGVYLTKDGIYGKNKDGNWVTERPAYDKDGKYIGNSKTWQTGTGLFSDSKYYFQGPNEGDPLQIYDSCTSDGNGGLYCSDPCDQQGNCKCTGDNCYAHYDKNGKLIAEGEEAKPPGGYFMIWFGNMLDKWASATAGYSGVSLFYDEPDPIIELDETISNMIGGIDGWTSEICKSDVSEAVSSYGTAFSPFPSGGAYAHIEGTKIRFTNYNTSNATYSYIYKISFSVSSGSDEYRGCDIDFLVYIMDGITKSLFKDSAGGDWTFKTKREGGTETISYAGTSMIAAQSQTNYNRLCIHFKDIDPNIVTPVGGYQTNCLIGIDSGDDLCVNIIDDGAKTLETKDPCDDSMLSFFMPLCWGSTTENRVWKAGEGVGGTSTSGTPAPGADVTGPILNI